MKSAELRSAIRGLLGFVAPTHSIPSAAAGEVHTVRMKTRKPRERTRIPVILALLFSAPLLGAGECPPPTADHENRVKTDGYSLEIESAAGAVGDVVPVNVAFRCEIPVPEGSQGGTSFHVAVCHDPSVATLVGEPTYSEEFLSLISPMGAYFYRISESAGGPGNQKGDGFVLGASFERTAYPSRIPIDPAIPMMTLYYRLKGNPGDAGNVTCCDATLERGNARCLYNQLHQTWTWGQQLRITEYLSQSHKPGTLTVLEGPTTRPDRPPEPPPVKVYPDRPSVAEADFRIHLVGGASFPQARNVPVEVYAEAAVEYSAFVIPIDFDEEVLRLDSVRTYSAGGAALIDNRNETPGGSRDFVEGHAVLYGDMRFATRRLAEEGEQIHVATLYFDILREPAGGETPLAVAEIVDSKGLPWKPSIRVRHLSDAASESEGIHSQIGPARTVDTSIRIEQREASVGDGNLDGRIDLTDAVAILEVLFLGGRCSLCFETSDFTGDRTVDLSDAVSILNFLFLGGSGPAQQTTICAAGV